MSPAEFCQKHAACREGRNFALTCETMSQVWETCPRADWLLWILERTTPLAKPQAVSLAIAFAETALQFVPADEQRPALAIQAAKTWLADPSDENARAAYAAAYAADAAYAAARAAAYAADAAARAAAYAAAYAADAADAAAYAARKEHAEFIRATIPNPFA